MDAVIERAADLAPVVHAPAEQPGPREWLLLAHASRRVKGSAKPRLVARRCAPIVAATAEEAWAIALAKLREMFPAAEGWVLALHAADSRELPEPEEDAGE